MGAASCLVEDLEACKMRLYEVDFCLLIWW